MSWLVNRQLATVGEAQRCHQAESFVADLPGELDPLCLELLDRGSNVVAHQVQLVPALPTVRVGSELGGRQREDQPATAGIDRGKPHDVTKERAQALGVVRKDDRVNPVDQGLSTLSAAVARPEPTRWTNRERDPRPSLAIAMRETRRSATAVAMSSGSGIFGI